MFTDAKRVIAEAVEARQIPGAVWAVARGGEVLALEAQGYADPELGQPMTANTVFDLASLTKVTATLPVVLRLLEKGYFRLDDPIAGFLPEYPHPEVRIRHLLAHNAGYPPGEKLWGRGWSRSEALDHIARLAPTNPPGGAVVYSDISFQLLGYLVERLTGRRLDEVAQEKVFGPLGMSGATFAPGPGAAPTEYREHLGRRQRSEVHDENATALEGVAGHAGLFSTVTDLIKYAGLWMGWPGHKVLSSATRAVAIQPHAGTGNDVRGLGWVIRSAQFSSSGDLMSPAAFGHTGFTGTSIWMDPQRDLAVILLTNRVYYGRQDHILRIRPRFHNAVVAALG